MQKQQQTAVYMQHKRRWGNTTTKNGTGQMKPLTLYISTDLPVMQGCKELAKVKGQGSRMCLGDGQADSPLIATDDFFERLIYFKTKHIGEKILQSVISDDY